MNDKFAYSEPMNLSEIRQKLNGKQLDIPGMFRYAKKQGVKVSDLSEDEKRMFLK